VGFYLLKNDELVLGPFQGKPACVRIPVGRGVCGTAVAENRTQRVYDVHQFEGHIACDAESNSEIVIPFSINGNIAGVLDIDSPEVGRFNENDQLGLEFSAGSGKAAQFTREQSTNSGLNVVFQLYLTIIARLFTRQQIARKKAAPNQESSWKTLKS
jgi:hypothetical protein